MDLKWINIVLPIAMVVGAIAFFFGAILHENHHPKLGIVLSGVGIILFGLCFAISF